MRNGVKLAMRRDDRWVQSNPASQFVTSSKTIASKRGDSSDNIVRVGLNYQFH